MIQFKGFNDRSYKACINKTNKWLQDQQTKNSGFMFIKGEHTTARDEVDILQHYITIEYEDSLGTTAVVELAGVAEEEDHEEDEVYGDY